MATVNFSSARIMREAAEHELALRRRREAVTEVIKERSVSEPVSAERVREALEELRQ